MAKSKKAKKPKPTFDVNERLDALGPVADYPYGRIAWWRERTTIIDMHRRRSRVSDPERLQEPTVEIAVDDPEATRKVRKNMTRVRQSEAWRHNQLSGMQRDAEREMELAWRARTAGLGTASQNYGVRIGGTSVQMASAMLEETWVQWTGDALRRRIRVAVVIDCLAEAKTLADIERAKRLKPGTAIEHYQRGLDLWCELRGWMRAHTPQSLDNRDRLTPRCRQC